MFPFSRYQYCKEIEDDDGNRYLDEPEPYRFVDAADNRYHTVKDGDTLWGLAHLYFAGFPRACGLWWVIADFQPTPIVDPTLRLQAGDVLVIPSLRRVRMAVFSAERRRYH